MGIQGPPGFLFERLSLSLCLLSNCWFRNYSVWDACKASTAVGAWRQFLKEQKLKGEKSCLGCCLWSLRICLSHPLKKCCHPKAKVCCLSPEELRVSDASQLLIFLIHEKSPFFTVLRFLQVPGLYHPEQRATLLARGSVWIAKMYPKVFFYLAGVLRQWELGSCAAAWIWVYAFPKPH